MSVLSGAQSTLLSRVPPDMRESIYLSAEYQNLCSDYVRAHVEQDVSKLVELLRDAGQFEDHTEKLNPKLGYVKACEESDVCLTQDNSGRWFGFLWLDPDEIPANKSEGTCILDFKKFAASHDLKVGDFRWHKELMIIVHVSKIGSEGDAQFDQDVIQSILTAPTFGVSDVTDFLAVAADYAGKPQIAAKLRTAEEFEGLFSDFLTPQSDVAASFETMELAAKHACEEYGLDAVAREIFQYWSVDDDMARQLEKRGEVVAREFGNSLTVWGRTKAGQMISLDGEIKDIVNEVFEVEMEALINKTFPYYDSVDENMPGCPIDILKALEEGRVKLLTATFADENPDIGRRVVSATVVMSNKPENPAAWVLKRGYEAAGIKRDLTSHVAVGLKSLPELLLQQEETTQITSTMEDLNADSKAKLARGIEAFHHRNQSSPMHKRPENLEQRLSAISANYGSSPNTPSFD